MERVHNFNAGPAALPLEVLEQAQAELLDYRGHAVEGSRSLMNVTFRLPSEELEQAFATQAEAQGMVGLRGHRSVGGMRASVYNAVPIESARALAQFMAEFLKENG